MQGWAASESVAGQSAILKVSAYSILISEEAKMREILSSSTVVTIYSLTAHKDGSLDVQGLEGASAETYCIRRGQEPCFSTDCTVLRSAMLLVQHEMHPA